MKNIAKKTAALLLVLSMIFSFAACKDKNSGDETTTGTVQADATVVGDETAASGDDTIAVSSEDSTAQAVTETDASGVADSLTSCFPEADVSLVSGGQPVYYYMIAAE